MKPTLWLMLLCLALPWLGAVDEAERERLLSEITGSLNNLTESHERLVVSAGKAQVVLPPVIATQIATRRTLAADWSRRIGTPNADFPMDEAETFRDGLNDLNGRIGNLAGWVDALASIDERWMAITATPHVQRYRAFVHGAVDLRLQAFGNDGQPAPDDDADWRRQSRYELLLSLIESEPSATERLAKIPHDDPAAREYRDQRSSLRTALEAAIAMTSAADDFPLSRDQEVLGELDDLLNVVQERHERLAMREHPPSPQVAAAIVACATAEQDAVRAVIGGLRARMPDDQAGEMRVEALRRQREQQRAITAIAWEWLDLDDSLRELHRPAREQIAGLPPMLQPQARTRLMSLDAAAGEAADALDRSLRAVKRTDAVRAKGALRLANQDLTAFIQELAWLHERQEQEADLDARLGAGAAAAKQQLAALWETVLAARARQTEAEHAVNAADLARELAEVTADEARIAAELARQAAEQAREQLDRRREQIIDAVENPAPKPEGDPKF
jgi:hypothetical protein